MSAPVVLNWRLCPSVARRYLPAVLNQFLHVYPNIEVELHDGPSEFVVERVRTGQVEFGICSLWSGEQGISTSSRWLRTLLAWCVTTRIRWPTLLASLGKSWLASG